MIRDTPLKQLIFSQIPPSQANFFTYIGFEDSNFVLISEFSEEKVSSKFYWCQREGHLNSLNAPSYPSIILRYFIFLLKGCAGIFIKSINMSFLIFSIASTPFLVRPLFRYQESLVYRCRHIGWGNPVGKISRGRYQGTNEPIRER